MFPNLFHGWNVFTQFFLIHFLSIVFCQSFYNGFCMWKKTNIFQYNNLIICACNSFKKHANIPTRFCVMLLVRAFPHFFFRTATLPELVRLVYFEGCLFLKLIFWLCVDSARKCARAVLQEAEHQNSLLPHQPSRWQPLLRWDLHSRGRHNTARTERSRQNKSHQVLWGASCCSCFYVSYRIVFYVSLAKEPNRLNVIMNENASVCKTMLSQLE